MPRAAELISLRNSLRYSKTHGKYSEEDLDIKLTHVEPVTFSDKSALFAVKCVRLVFDTGEFS